jgi:hypothetical protein
MLHIFTLGTDIKRIATLKESASLCDYKINYIIPSIWNGFQDKLLYVRDAIKDIPADDIICFIDAYDVIAYGSEEELVSKFKEHNCDFLISCEANCYPGEFKERHPILNTKTVYKYINSGTYIGYQFAVYDFLTWKSVDKIEQDCKHGTDQYYLMCYFLENYKTKRIMLDYDQTIFQVMYGISWHDFEIVDGRVYNTILKTVPCFLHFNGDANITYTGVDILPIFVERTHLSLTTGKTYTFKEFSPKYNQYGTWRPQLPNVKH